ncbi:unnamed protein product [Owenia fusiformis]|uniref:Uncharacterized protein n=1 Tax=Owenia fusiformis TaxID=6347 RepID=A0A8J1XKE3_OWEFU|nr:unnamed protein product [Owenia fusiformis]
MQWLIGMPGSMVPPLSFKWFTDKSEQVTELVMQWLIGMPGSMVQPLSFKWLTDKSEQVTELVMQWLIGMPGSMVPPLSFKWLTDKVNGSPNWVQKCLQITPCPHTLIHHIFL